MGMPRSSPAHSKSKAGKKIRNVLNKELPDLMKKIEKSDAGKKVKRVLDKELPGFMKKVKDFIENP